MYYAKSTCGFYDQEVNGKKNIPADAVEITAEQYIALLNGQSNGKIIVADSRGHPLLEDAPASHTRVPSSVTMRQARLALLSAGLLQSVEDAINILPEPSKTTANIEWNYSSEVHRESSFVILMGKKINLDDEALDNLFLAASNI